MKLKNRPDIYLKKRYIGTPKINERRQMLEIKQVEDISMADIDVLNALWMTRQSYWLNWTEFLKINYPRPTQLLLWQSNLKLPDLPAMLI